ncbi:MAG: hypothetical protein RPV21_10885 [Candidatus Sedimenticola sp. (ex Thyasira tokunagai)]
MNESPATRVVPETAVYLAVYGKNVELTSFDPPKMLIIVLTLTHLAVGQKCDELDLASFWIEYKPKASISQDDLTNTTRLNRPSEGAEKPGQNSKDRGKANPG